MDRDYERELRSNGPVIFTHEQIFLGKSRNPSPHSTPAMNQKIGVLSVKIILIHT